MSVPFRKITAAVSCVLSSSFSVPLVAQNLPSLEPVTVFATSRPQHSIPKTVASTTLTTQDIQRVPSSTLIDVLQGQAGVEIARHGGAGSPASVFLRGQASNQVAVFVNGLRVMTDAYGGVTIPDIPPDQIERIQILRGNLSAIYGEAAIGGAIHIYTKQPNTEGSNTFASVRYGSRNTYDLAASYAAHTQDVQWSLSATRLETDGFSAIDPKDFPLANPDNDRFQRNAASMNVETPIYPHVRVGVRSRWTNSLVAYDSAYDGPDATHFSQEDRIDSSIYGTWQVTPEWQHQWTWQYGKTEMDNYTNQQRQSTNKGNQSQWLWQQQYVSDYGDFSLLFENNDQQQRMVQNTYTLNQRHYDRQSYAYALGWSGVSDAWQWQLNLREDQIIGQDGAHKVRHSAHSWLAGGGYWWTPDTQILAQYSTSFRAPNTAELYGDVWGTAGNPELQPETHRGYEYGLSTTSRLGEWRAVYFRTQTHNTIEYDRDRFKNIARTENRGVELSLDGQQGPWKYHVNWVEQDPVNAINGKRLSRRAQHYGTMELRYVEHPIEWGAQTLVSGNRLDGEVRLASYQVLHLFAHRTLAKRWQLKVQLENVLNESYQLVHGYQTTPRGIFFTLQYR